MKGIIFIVLTTFLFSCCHAEQQIAKELAKLWTDIASSELLREAKHSEDIPDVSISLTSDIKYDEVIRVGDENPKVDTSSGLVEGITSSLAHSFYEIPYAEPPVGPLRFQPSIPLQTKIPLIDATTRKGVKCHQFEGPNCIITPFGCGRNMDEDCLLLNVFVPVHVNLGNSTQPPIDRLPVLFYIHGGSFNSGSGTGTDGRELANVTNTLVVTINYRLGPLGFIVHKETGEEDITGNQGLKDQQEALRWVQNNIENFGGDKSQVTIFGGSAGAQSVMFHTLSKVSEPTYARAIQQSNPAYITFQTQEESLVITEYITLRICNDTLQSERECLMNASPLELVNRQIPVMFRSLISGDMMGMSEPFRPVLDGIEFDDQPMSLYRDGKWNSDKNMIMGVNTEELDDIPYFIPEPVPTGKTLFTLVNYYIFGPGATDQVVKKYEESFPPESDDYAMTFGKEMTHLYFICPSRAMARFAASTATGGAKVFFYANQHPVLDGTCKSRNNGSEEGCYLASHGDEMRFVFRSTGNPTDEDRAVENQFSTYWGSFARTGGPSNGLESPLEGTYPDWPEYAAQSAKRNLNNGMKYPPGMKFYGKFLPILLESETKDNKANDEWKNLRIKAMQAEIEEEYQENICNFWDSIGFYMDPIPLPTPSAPRTTITEGNQEPTDLPVHTTSGAKSVHIPIFLVYFITFWNMIHIM